MDNGKVLIYYGEGHGKTCAAIGNAVRTSGLGGESIVIQFLKGKRECELDFIGRLEPELKMFRFEKSDASFAELSRAERKEESMNLKNGFNYGRKVITTGVCDLVVLDEALGLMDLGIVSFEEMKEVLSMRPDSMTVILTGRVLDEQMRELADEVYHIRTEQV